MDFTHLERKSVWNWGKLFYKVRHGLHPSQSEWAHKEFIEAGNLDDFLNKHLNDELNHFVELNREKKDFYGQE